MKSAGEILAPALRRALPRHSAIQWMVTAWPAIVGKRLAECTTPKILAEGALQISVSGKEWSASLEGADFAAEFRNRVNLAWGGTLVREVNFLEVKPRGPWIPKAADNNYTPFVRKGTSKAATHQERAGQQESKALHKLAGKEPRR